MIYQFVAGILCLSCNAKMSNTTAKLSKKEKKSKESFSSFLMVYSVQFVLILLPFLTVAQHESGIRKVISWSVSLYYKNVSSQCNLTAQIVSVQIKSFNRHKEPILTWPTLSFNIDFLVPSNHINLYKYFNYMIQ